MITVCRTLPELRHAVAALRAARGAIGLVPTMGALHDGHAALVDAAGADGAGVVASIFVNPTQFAAGEDFARYPRDEAGDLKRLEQHGCAIAWLPDVATMYPEGEATIVEVGGPARLWEGVARPGHYRGVATVCTKLFAQVGPDRAWFGEKDWQQCQVMRRMVADLCLPMTIEILPTVREPDGIAMSSRNRYLDAESRSRAPALYDALRACALAITAGTHADEATAAARARLTELGFATDYLACVDPQSLEETANLPARLIVASRMGGVRLLDTIEVKKSGTT